MLYSYEGAYVVPGVLDAVETYENNFLWDKDEKILKFPMLLSGASRDAGNGTTTILRSGLLMGRITATNKVKEWNPTGTDGSQYIAGILNIGINTQRAGGNQDRFMGHLICSGTVKAANIIVPGQANPGLASQTYEHWIKSMLYQRGFKITVEDAYGLVNPAPMGGWLDIVAKTADYAVLEADNNILFTNGGAAGAVNFTIPATAKKGLRYGFYVSADQTITVTAGTADTLIAANDIAADSIAFSTAGEKVGTFIEIFGDGAKWMSMVHLPFETGTPTIAT